ncbi:MAG: tetratricopeptide repeat protein [Myxococcaceae bacterium]
MIPLLLLLAVAPKPPPEPEPFPPFAEAFARSKAKPLSEAEIAERIAAGGKRYLQRPMSDLPNLKEATIADLMWPRRSEQLAFPTVLPGAAAVTSLAMNQAALEKIEQGEALFREGKLEDAGKIYREALQTCPECYLAWIQIGEVARATKQLGDALTAYDAAIKLNPHDYRPYFYKGLALLQKDKPLEAVAPWKASLALHPRNPAVMELVKKNDKKLRLISLPDVIRPRVYVKDRVTRVEIYFDPAVGAHWLAYGRCKALWLGDENHRFDVTGVAAHRFSAAEELECLGILVSSWEASKVEDPIVERISQVLSDKSGVELVLYELASRVNPHVTLNLSKGERMTLERYITKYVLPKS